MFSAISTSIKQLFTAITVLFSAFEKTAKSLDNLALVAEETSQAYVDQARSDRQVQLMKLNASAKQLKADLKAA